MRTATPVTTTTWHPHFNRRIPGIWLLAVLCLCLAMPAAHAAAGKRVALVLGNAAYQGEKPLVNPGNDAADMAALLGRMGFNGGKVKPLVNLGRKAMNAAVQDFLNQAEGAELAVVYYSGHGMQANGESFLIPVDAQIQSERDVRSEGIRLGELMEDLESKRIRHTLLVLDACRDNPYRTRTKSTSKGLAPPKEMNGAYLVAYATADGKTADDGTGRNGTYTSELLRHLGQPGISLRDAVEDTQLAVEETTRGQQRPKIYGDSARFRKVYLGDAATVVSPPSPGQAFKDCADCPEMVVIPAGSFVMGSGAAEQKRANAAGLGKEITDRETPQHRVSIQRFALGKYEVSRGEFGRFVASSGYRTEAEQGDGCIGVKPDGSAWEKKAGASWKSPGFAQADDHPVVCVSWNDARAYVDWLNRLSPGKGFRLASEAEWEYAARAGSQTAYPWGDDEVGRQMCSHANHAERSYSAVYTKDTPVNKNCTDGVVHTAGGQQFGANAFGLHHMHGNALEWVQDCFEDYYSAKQPTGGSAYRGNDSDCSRRVLRGGSWDLVPNHVLRSAFRAWDNPAARYDGYGFRLARTVP